ncbi:MAG TPA: hypothetical protein V6D35_06445 [Candidatus Sericytochromatia bacterium]
MVSALAIAQFEKRGLSSHLKSIDNPWRKISLHLTAHLHPDVSARKGAPGAVVVNVKPDCA